MKEQKRVYKAENIQTLEGMKHVREYPGMYIGSVTIDGLHHILKEIVSNSIDEYINGSGDNIKITFLDNGVLVEDNAMGIPHGKHDSGCSILQAVFGIMNTGGKYTKDGESGYNTSGGQHGVGAKATNALSSMMLVISKRDGIKKWVKFEKGVYVSEGEEKIDVKETGVSVLFTPDGDIFETIDFDFLRAKNQMREFSFLSKGLKFSLLDKRNGKQEAIEYMSENGLADYVEFLNKGKTVISNIFSASCSEGDAGVEVAFCYNTTFSDSVRLYTNNIPNTSGTHLTGFRSALTRAINEFARDKKILKDKDDNLTGEDLKEGQVLIINLKMLKPVYEGQNKEKLNSTEGRTITEQLIGKEIRVWLEENPKDGKNIIEKALLSRKAREAARKARESARKKAPVITQSVLPGKLADCISKNAEETEVYLVEG